MHRVVCNLNLVDYRLVHVSLHFLLVASRRVLGHFYFILFYLKAF